MGAVMVAVAGIYFFKLFFHIVIINGKIERLILTRDKEIREYRSPGMTIPVFESHKKYLTEKYNEQIEPLIRKKGYIFDILPFIPKK